MVADTTSTVKRIDKNITKITYALGYPVPKNTNTTAPGYIKLMRQQNLVWGVQPSQTGWKQINLMLPIQHKSKTKPTNITQMLKLHEGKILDKNGRHAPYRDTRGNLTIGYGCNIDSGCMKKAGYHWNKKPITENDATLLLNYHIKQCQNFLNSTNLGGYKSQNQARKDALTDLCYNMGGTILKTFKRTLKLIKNRHYTKAANNLKKTKYCKQVKTRCTDIRNLIKTGNH